ncbi:SDR family oxidoreductase [Labilithrix luteola]|nr:SDR family oxidoreductase [Labilithrix luteola]
MNIRDNVILVTGANRGLGRALVLASLEAGAKRIYAGARDPKQLEALVATAPDRIVPLALDVTDTTTLEAAAARATDVTMVFNNAGVLASFDALTSTTEEIARDLAINFYGLVNTTKAFLPALERAGANGGAAFVNVLSVASLGNVPGLGGYSASKAAAFSVTQGFRARLAGKGIRVFGVFPGPIDTDMVREIEMAKTSPADVANAILDGVQQGIEDISPDPVSRDVVALWKRDPKAVERQMATMG